MEASGSTEAVDTTNYEKFQTGNPVAQRLIGGFYRKVEDIVRPLKPATVLDAGCGEGETLDRLAGVLPPFPVGIDLNQESVDFAAERLPDATIRRADLLELPFEDDSFDLVFCLEVLEHLPDPGRAWSSWPGSPDRTSSFRFRMSPGSGSAAWPGASI